eukprot:5261014-Amphidinium_carterae.1
MTRSTAQDYSDSSSRHVKTSYFFGGFVAVVLPTDMSQGVLCPRGGHGPCCFHLLHQPFDGSVQSVRSGGLTCILIVCKCEPSPRHSPMLDQSAPEEFPDHKSEKLYKPLVLSVSFRFGICGDYALVWLGLGCKSGSSIVCSGNG